MNTRAQLPLGLIVSLYQYVKSLDILADSQSRILRIINVESEDVDTSGNEQLSRKADIAASEQSQTIKPGSRIPPMIRQAAQPQARKEWMALLNLPISTQLGSETDPNEASVLATDPSLRGVMLSRLIGAWISILGMSSTTKNADVRGHPFPVRV